MKEEKYIVLPENGIVVCEVYNKRGTCYRGTAKCNDADTFDENTGKRIAFLRAKNKYEKAVLRSIERQENKYIDMMAELNAHLVRLEKDIKRHSDLILKNFDEISELTNLD